MDAKKTAMLILEKRKPKDEAQAEEVGYEEGEDAVDTSEGLHACATELLDAVKADDVEGVAAALESAFDLMRSRDD